MEKDKAEAAEKPSQEEGAGKAGEMKELVRWFYRLSPDLVFWQPLVSLKNPGSRSADCSRLQVV